MWVMSNIPTSTQPVPAGDVHLQIDDEPAEFRQFVVYATSDAVDLNGSPIHEIPVELAEDTEDGKALAQALVAAADIYTAADGWLIEYRDAAVVPTDDLRLLAERLAADHWDEYIGVECQTCADAGIVETCGDVDGVCVIMKGDCPDCGTL